MKSHTVGSYSCILGHERISALGHKRRGRSEMEKKQKITVSPVDFSGRKGAKKLKSEIC